MRIWRLFRAYIARRRVPSMAFSLVLMVIVMGTLLWASKPWEEHSSDLKMSPGAPGPGGMPGKPGSPRIPPPTLIEKVWDVDSSTITPGEPLTVTLALRNVWDDRIEITDFPSAATLDQFYVDGEEQVDVELKRAEGASTTLEPGDEFTAVASITPDMSAVLQPGRYGIRLDVSIERGPDRRGSMLGFSMDSFVVIPSEGALDTTVVVDRARETDGIRITLDSLDFSPEQSILTVFAASRPNGHGKSAPANAPMPAATAMVVVRQGATPKPVSAPGPVLGVYPDLTARFRVDEEAWRELRHYGYRETPQGVQHEWTFGAVSANAESFELAVESVAHPEGDAVLTWKWVVPLGTQDRN